MLSCWYGCVLYFGAKSLVPVHIESLYEIGYVVLGRFSIFLISVTLLVTAIGLIMIYFIVFGDSFASIVRQTFFSTLPLDETNFFVRRTLWSFILGIGLTPVILKKEMAELKLVSITLFAAIGLFVLIFIV